MKFKTVCLNLIQYKRKHKNFHLVILINIVCLPKAIFLIKLANLLKTKNSTQYNCVLRINLQPNKIDQIKIS